MSHEHTVVWDCSICWKNRPRGGFCVRNYFVFTYW